VADSSHGSLRAIGRARRERHDRQNLVEELSGGKPGEIDADDRLGPLCIVPNGCRRSALILPFTGLGRYFGFQPPPVEFFVILAALVVAYLASSKPQSASSTAI
jgi:hypothetical protein